MKCKKVVRILPAYLDDELAAGVKKKVERHLKYCVLCRNELSALKESDRLLDVWNGIEPRKDFVGAIVSSIERESEEMSWADRFYDSIVRNKYKLVTAGANLLILAIILLNLSHIFRSGPTTKAGISIPVAALRAREAARPNYIDYLSSLSGEMPQKKIRPVEHALFVDSVANDMVDANFNIEPVGYRMDRVIERAPVKYRKRIIIYNLDKSRGVSTVIVINFKMNTTER